MDGQDTQGSAIQIVMASDDAYIQHLAVAAVSVMTNVRRGRSVHFHFLSCGLSEENKSKISRIFQNGIHRHSFYELDQAVLKSYPIFNHISPASYARLFLDAILPVSVTKLIYLDADTVVSGDIAELYDLGMKGHSLAAVSDIMARDIVRIFFYPGLHDYFNAGVLVIDLDQWRRRHLQAEANDFIRLHETELLGADQDVLNCLFREAWLPLDSRFNVDLKHRFFWEKINPSAVILHYSDRIKPWHYQFTGPGRKYYYEYLARTPWAGFRPSWSAAGMWRKYRGLVIRVLKYLARHLVPAAWQDNYRTRLWRNFKRKKI